MYVAVFKIEVSIPLSDKPTGIARKRQKAFEITVDALPSPQSFQQYDGKEIAQVGKRAQIDGLSKLDLFSFYSGKGMALSQRDEYDESDRYLDKAEDIYTGDPAIDDIRKDNRRGKRSNRNR